MLAAVLMVGRIMRYDNDVKAERRGIREQAANFVRAHLKNPRRAAVLGLAAAVGTGALAFTAAPQPADAGSQKTAEAAVQAVHVRADSAMVTRSLDRAGKPVLKQVKPAPSAKSAAAKKAGKSTRSS